MSDVTQILSAIEHGDPSAAEELLPLVYEELRKLAAQRMAQENPGQTLQATALVHEAYLRLVGVEKVEHWDSRGHFFASAAEAMRRILVDNARRKGRPKHGGELNRVALSDADLMTERQSLDLLALDEALEKLGAKDPRKAELVKLRFFAGLTNQQAAQVLGVATSTTALDWAYAKSWLRLEMAGTSSDKHDKENTMPHSKRRHLTHRQLAQSRLRRAAQRLFAEPLERRILLTAVTSVEPLANSDLAPVSTDISATFDQDIDVGTASPQSFSVHAMQKGQLTAAVATVTTSGATVTLDPTSDFFPGEVIHVTATDGIKSTIGDPVTPRVWQFRTAVETGTGLFTNSGQSLGDHRSVSTALGDLDGDGDLDVFVANANQENRVWLNNDGEFSGTGLGLLSDGNGTGVALADLDGDADLDAVVVNRNGQANRVWVNDGSGGFSDSGQALGNHDSRGVTIGDLDGDGDLDAFVANAFSGNRVWLNNGSGTLTDSGQTLGNHYSYGATLGDLDGDGDLDAFVVGLNQGNQIWLNDSGLFTSSGQRLGNHYSLGASLGDLDGDGDLDAFVANYSGQGDRVWLNDGGGTLTDSGQSVGDRWSNDVALGDLDGDGDLDAFAGAFSQGNRVWLNSGDGMFSDSGQRLGRGVALLGDLDGDGDLDAFGANLGVSRVWLNNDALTVALSVDETNIPEGAGTAIVTATLSGTSEQPVTVDLGFTGTATQNDDYTVSAAQIVIAAGGTNGSVTVTAVQDLVDEADETVILDITSVTNVQEAGTQQVTVTIQDDDEALPSVGLAVDKATIPEDGGVATFTATLSAAAPLPVIVELSLSGTASDADFIASSTQIVIGAGATSGSATVTAVQDATDEPSETVIADITKVTGGTENGTQQATTRILDDDEPPVPDVTLTVDNASIPEATGVATFTVTLSEATSVPVTVSLAIAGTATATDYAASGTQIVVAPGATTGSVTITAVQDEVNEPDETVILDITNVTGGNESGTQQQTTTIVDDDAPPSFSVSSLEPATSGFRVEFTNDLDASELNLYDTLNASLGLADVVVTGASSGVVAGSLVIGTSAITFIKSGDPLAADTYTVTLRSAPDGFKDTDGMLLDGNGDGTAGDDYVSNFTIDEAPADARTISIPDFVRGPGQDVNLPADETTGIPITISDGDNVRAADVRIGYDPALLEITGATTPAGGSVIVNTTTTPGVAILVFFSSASLPAGSSTFINLQATVPARAGYGRQQLLDLHSVTVGDGNDNEFPVVVDDAFHFTTYFADVSGNGRVNASDAAQVARFAALIDGGFAASLNIDPIVVGDISGNGRINAADASRVAQFAALIEVPEIPPIPAGVAVSGVAHLGPGLPDLRFPAVQVAPATIQATGIQSSGGSLLPQVGPDPYQAVDTVMASMVMLDDIADLRLVTALEDAMAELLSAELFAG